MTRDAVDELIDQWREQRPELEPHHLDAAATINRLARFLARVATELETALSKHGLKLGEFDVLSALRRGGPPFEQTPGQLIGSLFLSSGAMTNRIDRLERLGYVQRHAHPADGRGVIVRLTPSGRRTIDRAIETHSATEHRLLQVLTERDRRQLDRITRSLLES
jgi:DNA-binding MarR family transcriptional regulator